MYIAIYDENKKHITNVDNATYDLTTRVYDNDSFSAEGVCDVDINDAKIAVLNDDRGNYEYACFADEIINAPSKGLTSKPFGIPKYYSTTPPTAVLTGGCRLSLQR